MPKVSLGHDTMQYPSVNLWLRMSHLHHDVLMLFKMDMCTSIVLNAMFCHHYVHSLLLRPVSLPQSIRTSGRWLHNAIQGQLW